MLFHFGLHMRVNKTLHWKDVVYKNEMCKEQFQFRHFEETNHPKKLLSVLKLKSNGISVFCSQKGRKMPIEGYICQFSAPKTLKKWKKSFSDRPWEIKWHQKRNKILEDFFDLWKSNHSNNPFMTNYRTKCAVWHVLKIIDLISWFLHHLFTHFCDRFMKKENGSLIWQNLTENLNSN